MNHTHTLRCFNLVMAFAVVLQVGCNQPSKPTALPAAATVRLSPDSATEAMGVLRTTTVRDDLKLSDDQHKKLYELWSQRQPKGGGGGPASSSESKLSPEQFGSRAQTLIPETLTPQQFKRLQEILVQTLGAMYFMQPVGDTPVRLSPQQEPEYQAIMGKAIGGMREFASQNKLDLGQRRNSVTGENWTNFSEEEYKLERTALESVRALLTPEQRTAHDQAMGQQIDTHAVHMERAATQYGP